MKKGDRCKLSFPTIKPLHNAMGTIFTSQQGGYYIVELDDDVKWDVRRIHVTRQFINHCCKGSKEM